MAKLVFIISEIGLGMLGMVFIFLGIGLIFTGVVFFWASAQLVPSLAWTLGGIASICMSGLSFKRMWARLPERRQRSMV